MRKDLLKKLTDASLVKRYERGANEYEYECECEYKCECEWNDGSEGKKDSTEIKTVGADYDKNFFTLNPLEAMELTSTNPNHSFTSASASATNGSLNKDTFEKDTLADQTQHHDVYSNEFTLAGKRNYLTLRHEQNSAWAQSQFEKGIGYAKAALNPSCEQTSTRALVNKAEVCYKEGLEMIPHHPRLLTAYGALCINDGRLEMARDLITKSIALLQNKNKNKNKQKDNSDDEETDVDVDVDSDTLKDANTYLNVVDSKLHAKARILSQAKQGHVQLSVSNKAEQAMNDALAERAFLMGNDATKNNSKSTSFKASVGISERGARGQSDEYQLLSSSSDSEAESTKRRRRKRSHSHSHDKRRKHRKREKRKSSSRRKRDRDYDASSRKHKRRRDRRERSVGDEDGNDDGDSSASLESSDANRHCSRHRKHHKKRYRKNGDSTSRRERSRDRSRSRSTSVSRSR